MRKLISISLLFLLAANLKAQETTILTFDQLMNQVETNYPELQRYDPLIKASAERAEASRAWMPPVLSAGFDRIPYNPMMLSEPAPMNQSGFMLQIEQMIPNGTKNRLRAETELAAGREQESLREQSLRRYRRDAALAFLKSLNARKKHSKTEENLKVLHLLYEASVEKVAFGTTKPADIYKLEARIAEAENMLIMARAEEDAYNAFLNTLLLRETNSPLLLDSTSYRDPQTILADTASLANRPDIRAMQNRIDQMRLQRDLMAADRKPDFGFQFRHMQMFKMPAMYAVMGMMTIPFAPWSSDMYKGATRAMDFEIEAMQREKEAMVNMAQGMSADKAIMAAGTRDQITNLKTKIIPALKKAFEAELNEYGQNTGNLYVLLDTWEMLLMKELALIELQNRYREQLAELEFENYPGK